MSDLIGKRFGYLTVIGDSEKREYGYCVWKCKCDCGRIVYKNTRYLKKDSQISCGCKKIKSNRGNKAEDITGQVFGNLTAIERVESKNGKTRWLCKCQCGNQTIVNTHELKNGKVKSCGCRRHRKGLLMKDMTNQRFGRLVALYPTDKRDYKLSVYWHCRCDCGKEIDVTQAGLMSGNYKSCGCLRREANGHIHQKLHMDDGTCVEFLEKRILRKDNTSGYKGVNYERNHYTVRIGFKGKKYYVGSYKTIEEAIAARKNAEEIIYKQYLKAYYIWNEKAKNNKEWANQNPLIFNVTHDRQGFHIICNIDIEGDYNETQ